MNESDFSVVAKDAFPRIIKDLNKIVPDAKPVELFLMSIYGGFIQDWTLEIQPNGINLLPGERAVDVLTYVPQLAMVCDLMSGRISEIFSSLKFESVDISGEIALTNDKSKEQFVFSVKEKTLVERYKVLNDPKTGEKKQLEFGFDFSKNTVDTDSVYAPLKYEQNTLLKLIQNHHLETVLKTTEVPGNIKRKI